MVWAPSVSAVVSSDWAQLAVPVAVMAVPESTWTWTLLIPATLEAEPETVIVPETSAPPAGVEIDTLGGELLNVTDTDAVDVWPTESVAMAEMVWPPSE